jgi:hypothetical protein
MKVLRSTDMGKSFGAGIPQGRRTCAGQHMVPRSRRGQERTVVRRGAGGFVQER